MKFYPPMYLGDGIFRPGTVPGGNTPSFWEEAVSKQNFVRSNIASESAVTALPAAPALVVATLEQRARAARSAWVGSKLKSFYVALVRKFERGGQAELENYLAASQSLADLEERIRHYERRHSPYF